MNITASSAAELSPVADEPVLILEPGRADRHYWADLWRYRELFYILAWRDVSVRCKQTIIGVRWAVSRPCLTIAVFAVICGRVAGLPRATATRPTR